MVVKAYDVIVMGSGGGMKIAIPAANQGLRVAFIEKDAMGGTCLNRGCIPSKMLIYPADLINRIRQAHKVDLGPFPRAAANFENLVDRISHTVDQMSATIEKSLEKQSNLHVYHGEGRFVSGKKVQIGGVTLTAEWIFIAVGSRPSIPSIDGLKTTPYWTSAQALRNRRLPERLIIIGAGYVACELGHAFNAFGTDTHFLVRSELLRHEDKDIRTEFQRVFNRFHHIHKGVIPVHISYENGRFQVTMKSTLHKKEKILMGDALLVATGIKPNTDRLGLENTVIRLDDKGFIQVDDQLETDEKGVYALGDCVGRYFYRHTVNFQGEFLMRTLFESPQKASIEYGPVPHAIFAYPEVAGVGSTEDELIEAGLDYVAGRAFYPDSNVGLARQLDCGFAKVLADKKTGKLLGAHIVGDEASDVVHLVIAFMSQGAGLDELLRMIYIHPALPEIVRDAARDAKKQFHTFNHRP